MAVFAPADLAPSELAARRRPVHTGPAQRITTPPWRMPSRATCRNHPSGFVDDCSLCTLAIAARATIRDEQLGRHIRGLARVGRFGS